MNIIDILQKGTTKQKRSLFSFNKDDSDEAIVLKFNLWSRYFFIRYFKSEDAEFHSEMDLYNVKAYRGSIRQFVDIAFRGGAKTARTKLFIAFVIANDMDHTRRFMRCMSADLDNAKQSVTDIYNMLIQPRVKEMYPEIFEKTDAKREETMGSFTTSHSDGVKLLAKQIGVDQRGKIMEDAKSDFDWYDDIETKTTIRSAITTKKIGENMEEARTGLALGGSSIYTANYFSEMGNVHDLVTKNMDGSRKESLFTQVTDSKVVMIVPIWIEGVPVWSRYTVKDIKQMQKDDEDFEGERLCKPNASKDIYFDRDSLEAMPAREPLREIADFKIFHEYNPSHRIAGGHDIAGGVGLDSSTSVFIDFDTIPARVIATYKNNMIQPEAFGDEIYSQGNKFGACLLAVENNKFDQAILKAKLLGANLFKMKGGKEIKIGYQAPTAYGWNTNSLTKSKMLSAMKAAVEDGLIELSDKDLIQEFKSYTRNDLIDNDPDIRMTTRHFDLLIAACIAWQMKDFVEHKPGRLDPNNLSNWSRRSATKQKGNPAR